MVRTAISTAGPGSPLPAGVANVLRARLGADLSAVRVHTGPAARASTAALGVRAFTWDNGVYLGAGEQADDVGLMAHEVTHVLQQSAGPAVRLFGGAPDAYEREAQAVAAGVAGGEPVRVSGRTGGATVQGAGFFDTLAGLGKGALDAAVGFVRDKANLIPGYNLLAYVLGRDPISDKPVERTAGTLLKALITLVPLGALILSNLEQAKVIERAGAWLAAELPKLSLTWAYVRGLFSTAWAQLGVTDLLSPAGAWAKVSGVFTPPLTRLKEFAVGAGRKLVEFVFEGAISLGGTYAPEVLAVFRRIGPVFDLVTADPVRFLRNLLDAVKGGVAGFAKNILAHLKTALFEWLLGALGGTLTLPSKWDFAGILSVILQVLGLTYGALRGVLVKIVGEPAVTVLEKSFEFVVLIRDKGLAAAWERLKEYATGMADAVIAGIRDWVAQSVVTAAITKIVSMFNPVGAIVQAIIATYNTVMFFLERAKQIARVVNSVLDSVEAIAKGATASASAFVERTMAQTLPVIIAFLARLVGLGNVSEHVRKVIAKIQATVLGAVEKVARWIADKAKGLLARRGTKDAAKDPKAALANPEKAKSDAVRAKAYAALQAEAAKNPNADQIPQAVRSVATRLRPEGLQKLEAAPPTADGAVIVSAAASEFLPLAGFFRGAPPAGRAVTLFAEIRLAAPTPYTAGRLEPLGSDADDLRGAGEVHPGVTKKGAGVVRPQPAGVATPVVRVATWNTSDIHKVSNNSHAEHQFVLWLKRETQLHGQVQSIMLNLRNYAPCATCGDELLALIKTLTAARGSRFGRGQAVLSWVDPYPGYNPRGDNATTADELRLLNDAGWTLHGKGVGSGHTLSASPFILRGPTYRPPA